MHGRISMAEISVRLSKAKIVIKRKRLMPTFLYRT